jgi:hypothetical protein
VGLQMCCFERWLLLVVFLFCVLKVKNQMGEKLVLLGFLIWLSYWYLSNYFCFYLVVILVQGSFCLVHNGLRLGVVADF